MIGCIRGCLLEKTPEFVVLDVGGVGYRVFVTLPTFYSLPEVGGETFLQVHTVMREDAIQLFGFATREERVMYRHLIAVSGVGPKLARNILSGIQYDDLREAILSDDLYRINSVPGVGKKTAERLIVDLRDRLSKEEPEELPEPATGGGSLRGDVLSALINLGYKREIARRAIDRAIKENPGEQSLETLLRESLRLLSSK